MDTIKGHINDLTITIKGNLKSGATIKGKLSIPQQIAMDYYDGDYEVTPTNYEQVLYTHQKTMREDVTVHKTPYAEVSNPYGGETVTIL